MNKTGAEGVLVTGLRQAGAGKPIRKEVVDPRNPMNFEDCLAAAEPLSGDASLIKQGIVIALTTRLFDAGADGKLKSNEGKTAFDYAKENLAVNDSEVYTLLKNLCI